MSRQRKNALNYSCYNPAIIPLSLHNADPLSRVKGPDGRRVGFNNGSLHSADVPAMPLLLCCLGLPTGFLAAMGACTGSGTMVALFCLGSSVW